MTDSPENRLRSQDGRQTQRQIYIKFQLKPSEAVLCPLTDPKRDISGIKQQLIDNECHTDITIDTKTGENGKKCPEVVHTSVEVNSPCICKVFHSHDCIPEISEANGQGIQIETYLSDRSVLSELVEDLKPIVDELQLRQIERIERAGGSEGTETVMFNLSRLTETQRETAIRAVELGYYSTPRETSFEELAKDLDISKSALSRRLNAVEAKLVSSACGTVT